MWHLHVKFDTKDIKATLSKVVECSPQDIQRLLYSFVTDLYWQGWPTSNEADYLTYYTPG